MKLLALVAVCSILLPLIEAHDLSLEIVLNDTIAANTEYTSLFKVKNVNYTLGHVYNITVHYAVFENDSIIISDDFRIDDLNQFKTASTGRIQLNKGGTYRLVGEITASSITDENPANDLASKIITVPVIQPQSCDLSININLNKTIFNNSETMNFSFIPSNTTQPYTIEYWIEDLSENYYKHPLNTSNLNQKSWVASVNETEKILILKARLYPTCDDTDLTNNEVQQLIVVQGAAQPSPLVEDTEPVPTPNQSSHITITNVPSTAIAGEAISIDVAIYKGNTQKYSISAYAEKDGKKISEITKIQIRGKYQSFNGSIPLTIKSTATSGTATIVVEGLDESDEKSIAIQGVTTQPTTNNNSSEEETTNQPLFVYEIKQYPEQIAVGEQFTIDVQLINNDDVSIALLVWSYVYRASKSYSGDRESNQKSLALEPGESTIVSLPLTVEQAESGAYKMKVIINKDQQKTNKELTTDIEIIGSKIETVSEDLSSGTTEEATALDTNAEEIESSVLSASMAYRITNELLCTNATNQKEAVYQSSDTKRMQLPLLLGAITLLGIALVWRG